MKLNAHLAPALAALFTLVGCSGGTGTGATQNAGSTSSSGTPSATDPETLALQCAPSTAQLSACAGVAAGGSCSLSKGWDGGWTWPGTCRPTVDGTQVACVPNPPAPPTALVDACTGKTSGEACQAEGKFGGSFAGTCLTAPGSSSLFCGHVRTPPPAAVEACAGLDAGAACSHAKRWEGDAGTRVGVCRFGPADAGPLACAPVAPSESPGVAACVGLDAGAGCALGFGRHRWDNGGPSGSCVVPAAGGAATCVVPCEDLHGFRGHGHPGWGFGGGPWGHWGRWPADAGSDAP